MPLSARTSNASVYLTPRRGIGREVINSVVRNAHKRSMNSDGKAFRINVEGNDPRYSFHWTGISNRLYVFEAPIDLLSFITLYPQDWHSHSYDALCGTSEHAMLWMLEQNPKIQKIALCLDHDAAGQKAVASILKENDYTDIVPLLPDAKDWNDELLVQRKTEQIFSIVLG